MKVVKRRIGARKAKRHVIEQMNAESSVEHFLRASAGSQVPSLIEVNGTHVVINKTISGDPDPDELSEVLRGIHMFHGSAKTLVEATWLQKAGGVIRGFADKDVYSNNIARASSRRNRASNRRAFCPISPVANVRLGDFEDRSLVPYTIHWQHDMLNNCIASSFRGYAEYNSDAYHSIRNPNLTHSPADLISPGFIQKMLLLNKSYHSVGKYILDHSVVRSTMLKREQKMSQADEKSAIVADACKGLPSQDFSSYRARYAYSLLPSISVRIKEVDPEKDLTLHSEQREDPRANPRFRNLRTFTGGPTEAADLGDSTVRANASSGTTTRYLRAVTDVSDALFSERNSTGVYADKTLQDGSFASSSRHTDSLYGYSLSIKHPLATYPCPILSTPTGYLLKGTATAEWVGSRLHKVHVNTMPAGDKGNLLSNVGFLHTTTHRLASIAMSNLSAVTVDISSRINVHPTKILCEALLGTLGIASSMYAMTKTGSRIRKELLNATRMGLDTQPFSADECISRVFPQYLACVFPDVTAVKSDGGRGVSDFNSIIHSYLQGAREGMTLSAPHIPVPLLEALNTHISLTAGVNWTTYLRDEGFCMIEYVVDPVNKTLTVGDNSIVIDTRSLNLLVGPEMIGNHPECEAFVLPTNVRLTGLSDTHEPVSINISDYSIRVGDRVILQKSVKGVEGVDTTGVAWSPLDVDVNEEAHLPEGYTNRTQASRWMSIDHHKYGEGNRDDFGTQPIVDEASLIYRHGRHHAERINKVYTMHSVISTLPPRREGTTISIGANLADVLCVTRVTGRHTRINTYLYKSRLMGLSMIPIHSEVEVAAELFARMDSYGMTPTLPRDTVNFVMNSGYVFNKNWGGEYSKSPESLNRLDSLLRGLAVGMRINRAINSTMLIDSQALYGFVSDPDPLECLHVNISSEAKRVPPGVEPVPEINLLSTLIAMYYQGDRVNTIDLRMKKPLESLHAKSFVNYGDTDTQGKFGEGMVKIMSRISSEYVSFRMIPKTFFTGSDTKFRLIDSCIRTEVDDIPIFVVKPSSSSQRRDSVRGRDNNGHFLISKGARRPLVYIDDFVSGEDAFNDRIKVFPFVVTDNNVRIVSVSPHENLVKVRVFIYSNIAPDASIVADVLIDESRKEVVHTDLYRMKGYILRIMDSGWYSATRALSDASIVEYAKSLSNLDSMMEPISEEASGSLKFSVFDGMFPGDQRVLDLENLYRHEVNMIENMKKVYLSASSVLKIIEGDLPLKNLRFS